MSIWISRRQTSGAAKSIFRKTRIKESDGKQALEGWGVCFFFIFRDVGGFVRKLLEGIILLVMTDSMIDMLWVILKCV